MNLISNEDDDVNESGYTTHTHTIHTYGRMEKEKGKHARGRGGGGLALRGVFFFFSFCSLLSAIELPFSSGVMKGMAWMDGWVHTLVHRYINIYAWGRGDVYMCIGDQETFFLFSEILLLLVPLLLLLLVPFTATPLLFLRCDRTVRNETTCYPAMIFIGDSSLIQTSFPVRPCGLSTSVYLYG